MRQAERDLRQALAEKLSVMKDVPLRLMLQLANDDAEVAGSVLTKSVVLSDLDLIYIITAKGADHWQHIAKRAKMSDQIINILVDTNEKRTVKTLVENDKITLTEYAIDVVTDMACKDEVLAKPLLRRDEVTEDIAKRIYQHVGKALKEYIVEKYDLDLDGSVTDLVDEAIMEFVDAADENAEILPSSSMLNTAERHHEKGLLTIKMMIGCLRRGQIQTFIAQFSKYTGMSPDTISDTLIQNSGQGLAVVCRAFNIAKEDFMSIFLLTNRLRNNGKMVDLKDMAKAMEYYTRVDTKVAIDVVKNSLEDTLKD